MTTDVAENTFDGLQKLITRVNARGLRIEGLETSIGYHEIRIDNGHADPETRQSIRLERDKAIALRDWLNRLFPLDTP